MNVYECGIVAVDAKGEGCSSGAVFPEAWGVLHWVISEGCDFWTSFLNVMMPASLRLYIPQRISKYTCPLVPMVNFFVVHDFIGYECAVDAEVLSVLH